MAWTIRRDSLELWPGLVLHGMGEVDFHVFGKYWKLTSSPNTSKLVLEPPDWSSEFFESQGTISEALKPINFPKNDPNKKIFSGKLDNFQQSSLFDKMVSFFIVLFWPHAFFWAPWGPGPQGLWRRRGAPQNAPPMLATRSDGSLKMVSCLVISPPSFGWLYDGILDWL